jgi:hypothetical protein
VKSARPAVDRHGSAGLVGKTPWSLLFESSTIRALSRRTSHSQYRLRYGQPLGNDGVFIDLIVILCLISATTLIAFLPLVVSGRGKHHVFLNLYVLRHDGNEAYKQAVALSNLAGTWNSDLDFEVFDIK